MLCLCRWWTNPTVAVLTGAGHFTWMFKVNQVDTRWWLRVQNPTTLNSGKDVGEEEKQAYHELWEAKPWHPLLLWQFSHRESSWKKICLPVFVWHPKDPRVWSNEEKMWRISGRFSVRRSVNVTWSQRFACCLFSWRRLTCWTAWFQRALLVSFCWEPKRYVTFSCVTFIGNVLCSLYQAVVWQLANLWIVSIYFLKILRSKLHNQSMNPFKRWVIYRGCAIFHLKIFILCILCMHHFKQTACSKIENISFILMINFIKFLVILCIMEDFNSQAQLLDDC